MKELLERYPTLASVSGELEKAKNAIINCYENGGKILICGNGGSSADSDHIVGELMKGFLKKRPLSIEKKAEMKAKFPDVDEDILNKLQGALPAVSLSSFAALNTAFSNDVDPELIFAQALLGLGRSGDALIALSTSGNSRNAYAAAKLAKSLGITLISLTGMGGGKLGAISDICIAVAEKETYKVQELHLPVYHWLCAKVEEHFFSL